MELRHGLGDRERPEHGDRPQPQHRGQQRRAEHPEDLPEPGGAVLVPPFALVDQVLPEREGDEQREPDHGEQAERLHAGRGRHGPPVVRQRVLRQQRMYAPPRQQGVEQECEEQAEQDAELGPGARAVGRVGSRDQCAQARILDRVRPGMGGRRLEARVALDIDRQDRDELVAEALRVPAGLRQKLLAALEDAGGVLGFLRRRPVARLQHGRRCGAAVSRRVGTLPFGCRFGGCRLAGLTVRRRSDSGPCASRRRSSKRSRRASPCSESSCSRFRKVSDRSRYAGQVPRRPLAHSTKSSSWARTEIRCARFEVRAAWSSSSTQVPAILASSARSFAPSPWRGRPRPGAARPVEDVGEVPRRLVDRDRDADSAIGALKQPTFQHLQRREQRREAG